MSNHTRTPAQCLPNIVGERGQRRPDIERRLNANVERGSLFSAHLNPDRKTYRVVTSGGTLLPKVTLAQADAICSVAASAYNAGVASR